MPTDRHFVGRRDERARFRALLEDPAGRAVLIVGPQGMGKSFLARKLLEDAETHPTLTCGAVRYEVTATDPPEAVMERMLEDGFAATAAEGSLSASPQRRRQWKALFETVVPKGKDLLALGAALQRNPRRPAREQLAAALAQLSDELPDHHRVLFLVDSEKSMQDGSDQPWCLVARELPPKIVLLFAQRPDDALATSADFERLPPVERIPDHPLGQLAPGEVDQLLRFAAVDLEEHPLDGLRDHFARLDGHPYAVAASIDLLLEGVSLADLPLDPDGIAAEQWRQVLGRGDDASRLFEAHAVLDVPVPDDVAREVARIEPRTHRRLLADRYLAGLLLADESAEPSDRRRIYHSLLADHVLHELTAEERRTLHGRAIAAYRERFEADAAPDPLPALRLPEHVLEVEGEEAFADCIVYRAARRLIRFGLLEEAEDLLNRAEEHTPEGSALEAGRLNALGLIHQTRGDLDGAEKMHHRSLEISEGLEDLKGMAIQYGNLGLIHKTRRDLDRAEEMFNRSLEIGEGLGGFEGMANQYGNLGIIHAIRGHLDRAEEMFNRSLEIEKRLGRPEGIAVDYGNLGIVHQSRGNLVRAEEMLNRSLKIEERLGRLEGMARQYGNLGVIHGIRGDLDRAEEMFNRSLEIEKRLGRLEGVAIACGNLGMVSKERGDLKQAGTHWRRSLDLFRQLGTQDRIEQIEADLASLGDAETKDEPTESGGAGEPALL